MNALLLTGGPGHPAEASVGPLRGVLAEVGLGLDVDDDVERGLASLGPDHDLLVVNALRFAMTHTRYDDVRDREAFTLSEAGAAAIARWHGSGRPVLALHTAVISFDTTPEWSAILGGRWDWSRSHHPPLGRCRVTIGPEGSGTGIDVVDETYRDLDLDPGNDVVAWSTVDGVAQPAAWTRAPDGAGRVAVDLLGHDARSLTHPGHAALLHGLLGWVLGRTDTVEVDIDEGATTR